MAEKWLTNIYDGYLIAIACNLVEPNPLIVSDVLVVAVTVGIVVRSSVEESGSM